MVSQRVNAAIKRRQGHWQESLDAYSAQQLDPQNRNIVRNVIFTNTALRRWPAASQAAREFARWRRLSITAKIQSGYIDFWWKGETALLKSLVNEVSAGTDPDGAITAVRWEIAMLEHDYASAQKVLAASPLTEFSVHEFRDDAERVHGRMYRSGAKRCRGRAEII